MSFSNNLRPENSQILEMALSELHIERGQPLQELNTTERSEQGEGSFEIVEEIVDLDGNESILRRSVDDRALLPRVSSLENSLIEHINTSVPSLDELMIRQRGRKKQPSKISWSPIKSPFKTPTKRNSSLHMSLLSPSPAKKSLNQTETSMVLRNSPRKRILSDDNDQSTSTTSTPMHSSTPTKRLKFSDDRSMNANNKSVPLKCLLKAMSQNQLIDIICGIANKDAEVEQNILKNLPIPDIRPFEDELCKLKRIVAKGSPRSRLLIQNNSDGAFFPRASTHLQQFKKAIANHCKILQDSHAFDALIDYVLMAWVYVRGLPSDEFQYNVIRRDCFKLLTLNAKIAFKQAGCEKIGVERVETFRRKFKSMSNDYNEIKKCRELSF